MNNPKEMQEKLAHVEIDLEERGANQCPDCGAPVHFGEGCSLCLECGFSTCG